MFFFFTIDYIATRDAFLTLVLSSCAFFIGLQVCQWKNRDVLLKLFVLIGFLTCLLGLYQKWVSFPYTIAVLQEQISPSSDPHLVAAFDRIRWGRIFATFRHVNTFAGFLLILVPLTIHFIVSEKSKIARVFYSSFLILELVSLIFTKSVGAFLVLGLMFVIAAILTMPHFLSRWPRRLVWLIVGLVTLLFLISLYLIVQSRSQAIFSLNEGSSVSMRWHNWRIGGEIFRQHPLTGVGYGSFGAIYPKFMQPGANETHFAHNIFVQMLAETGIIGLIMTLGLIAGYIAINLRQTAFLRLEWFLFLAGLGFWMHNLVDFDFYFSSLAVPALFIIGLSNGDRVVQIKPSGIIIIIALLTSGMTGLVGWTSTIAVAKHHANRALVAFTHDEPARTIDRHLQKALELDGNNDIYLTDYADFLVRQENSAANCKQAIALYERALDLKPTDAAYYYRLGLIYFQQGDSARAAHNFERAAHFYPLNENYSRTWQRFRLN